MAKPLIIRCPFIPRRYCINLFGTFWARDTSWITPRLINHERIHTAQMHELLFIPFYIFYLLEWGVKMLKYRNRERAYMAISFEREAYGNDANFHYLSVRRPYSWLRYLRRPPSKATY